MSLYRPSASLVGAITFSLLGGLAGVSNANAAEVKLPQLSVRPQWDGAGPDTYFYAPGKAVRVNLKVANASAKTIEWEAHDFAGQTIGQGKQVLDASGNGQFQVKPASAGIVYISAKLLGENGTSLAQANTTFAALRPRPVDVGSRNTSLPILYGVATHLHGLGAKDSEREAAIMALLGFPACRFDVSWPQIQPNRDEWKWELNDRLFAQLEKYKISPLPILGYGTRWASTADQNAADEGKWRYAPPITADYAKFASEVAKRYGRTTDYWEIWNEPDIASWLGTPEQYATLFDAAIDAIHSADPGSKVMNGGFSETKRRPDFIPAWQKAVRNMPDIYAFHTHGALNNLLRAGDEAKRNRQLIDWKMPLWLNESGFSSSGNVTEREQAIALIKKMSFAPSLGVDAYFWYDLYNDGKDPNENEHNFGLIRNDYTPKASAVAAHTLLSALKGKRFVRSISLPEVPQAHALLFERTDKTGGTLVLWNEGTGSVPIYWKANGASRISMMGEETTLTGKQGLTVLAATPEPVFMNFKGDAQQFDALGSLIEFPSSLSVAPGQSEPLRLTLKNPLAKPLRGTLKLKTSGGWQVDKTELPFTVAPNTTGAWNLSVKAPASMPKAETLELTLNSSQLPATKPAQARLMGAIVIPRQNTASTIGDTAHWGKPQVRLSASNRVGLFEAAPLLNMFFRGDDDLSAEVSMKRVPQGLSLAVRVRDDIFAQQEAPNEEWRGDSIQWALALPSGEHYEWYAALTKDGPVANLGLAPRGVKTGRTELPLWIQRQGNETLYETIIPETLPGGATLTDKLGFTLIVNDNDGSGRKGWAEWTPGIGRTKDPKQFQSFVVAPAQR